ncbi:hypothetical protein Phep_3904 [Pedobacter heparinus DSM 2366]|uniref:Glycosyltransferase subfamily 4-like N-terminal domain-containing protein n=2 Tax=Pedobacter heparinus TaxID=984 RepID=C6XVM0_PEDHD|nr:hypothetical protein Phep_3904 [Pedobacter heparinus DSM 2366]
MSLPYFEQFGWEAEIVTVDPKYSDLQKDDLLMQGIPEGLQIHYIQAFDKKLTSPFGLGSLALRSLWFYFRGINKILKSQRFDLIYFSTTQFPVCILGAYWKKRVNIPYVIDMQDPWHSDYYQDKPKAQRPAKYWFSYRLNKYLEPIAMKHVGGLISVADDYIQTLKNRYPQINKIPSSVITFGAFEKDFEIAESNQLSFKPLLHSNKINIVYVGRGGLDMHTAIKPVFEALYRGLQTKPEVFKKLQFSFIGTSYAPAGQGKATVLPLARKYQVEEQVTEITERISFYHTLNTLQQADALFIPGSDDPQYTASKIYPYLLVKKPLLAVFHRNSSVVEIVNKCIVNARLIRFPDKNMTDELYSVLTNWANNIFTSPELTKAIKEYSAENMTKKQTELFNKVIGGD